MILDARSRDTAFKKGRDGALRGCYRGSPYTPLFGYSFLPDGRNEAAEAEAQKYYNQGYEQGDNE